MTTGDAFLSDQYLSSISPGRRKHSNEDLLNFLERSLCSIKAEMAAGTPVDADLVTEMERRLKLARANRLF